MIKLRPDWCLSRQRYWGVPIPALECEGCKGAHYLFPEVIEHFANIVKERGSDAWFELEIKDLIPAGFKCPNCGKSDFKKTHDILDVWFDSGVSHQAVMRGMLGEENPVAQMYLEGSDQHRGWFQSSIIPSVAMEGRPPFESVLTHGFVVDADGRKMSKSLGNVISPLDIMQTNGADILRLWVASSDYSEDIRISSETINRLGDSYRKIRNTFRYLLGNLHGFDPDKNMLEYDDLLGIDKWALYRLATTVDAVKGSYNIDGKSDAYDFAGAFRALYDFCNEDLSSCYLDVLKDRLYTYAADTKERLSAQTVLYHITDHLVRLVAPILAFTSEEIFALMPKQRGAKDIASVHLLEFLEVPLIWKNKDVDDYFELIYTLRPHVLKALEDKRREGLIGSSLEAKIVFRTVNEDKYRSLQNDLPILPAMFIVSQAEVEKAEDIDNPLADKLNDTEIVIKKAEGQKCPRCWNYRLDIGLDKEHPAICQRCAKNVR
jgi:isoleucyl-tRNA synthetase